MPQIYFSFLSILILLPTLKKFLLKNFISFSEPQDLIGENINKFFPEKSDGIDLVITHADYETVEIKIIPIN